MGIVRKEELESAAKNCQEGKKRKMSWKEKKRMKYCWGSKAGPNPIAKQLEPKVFLSRCFSQRLSPYFHFVTRIAEPMVAKVEAEN